MENSVDNVENVVEKLNPVDNVEKSDCFSTERSIETEPLQKKANKGFTLCKQHSLRLLLSFKYKNKIIKEEGVDKYGNQN